jgi:hypothetical protein
VFATLPLAEQVPLGFSEALGFAGPTWQWTTKKMHEDVFGVIQRSSPLAVATLLFFCV